MMKRLWFVLAVPFLLAACASDQQRADDSAVQASGVSPAVYDKMLHDDPLGVSDIAALRQARVNDGIVIRYIRDHGTIYVLSQGEISYLQNAGVSPSVIDYMVQTGRGGAGGPGPGPFFFGPPISIGVGVGGGGRWR